jgi:hypothetical protein
VRVPVTDDVAREVATAARPVRVGLRRDELRCRSAGCRKNTTLCPTRRPRSQHLVRHLRASMARKRRRARPRTSSPVHRAEHVHRPPSQHARFARAADREGPGPRPPWISATPRTVAPVGQAAEVHDDGGGDRLEPRAARLERWSVCRAPSDDSDPRHPLAHISVPTDASAPRPRSPDVGIDRRSRSSTRRTAASPVELTTKAASNSRRSASRMRRVPDHDRKPEGVGQQLPSGAHQYGTSARRRCPPSTTPIRDGVSSTPLCRGHQHGVVEALGPP